MKKVFEAKELFDIETAANVILGCLDMGGLAPYQESVLRRRTLEILNIIRKGGKQVD